MTDDDKSNIGVIGMATLSVAMLGIGVLLGTSGTRGHVRSPRKVRRLTRRCERRPGDKHAFDPSENDSTELGLAQVRLGRLREVSGAAECEAWSHHVSGANVVRRRARI